MENSSLPAIFFAHGNPMNALADNAWTQSWRAIGEQVGKPRGVVMVSAHWYIRDTRVTAMAQPPTIHDFGGFPKELFAYQYPAPGSPDLARRVSELVGAAPDQGWGLDHGTWSVLCHVFPDAQVPIVQLSIDATQPPERHYALGQLLSPLRQEGILIAASGNVIHNLRAYAWGRENVPAYDWAVRFENRIRDAIVAGDHGAVIRYDDCGEDARLSSPTPDHFLPLLYVLGASLPGDRVSFPTEGTDGGSISMLSVALGA